MPRASMTYETTCVIRPGSSQNHIRIIQLRRVDSKAMGCHRPLLAELQKPTSNRPVTRAGGYRHDSRYHDHSAQQSEACYGNQGDAYPLLHDSAFNRIPEARSNATVSHK